MKDFKEYYDKFVEKMIGVYLIRKAHNEKYVYVYNIPTIGSTIQLDRESWSVVSITHDFDYFHNSDDSYKNREMVAVYLEKIKE